MTSHAVAVTPPSNDVAPFAITCIATGIHSSDRERWLRARRRGLGGSDVAAILGMHPYKSALEVYADKVGSLPVDADAGEVALWGNIFEGPILSEFARRSGRRIVPNAELLQSRQRPIWLATPDGIQLDGGPVWALGPGTLEVKMTALDWSGELAGYVQVQVQMQLLVTGALWGSCIWLPVPERRLQTVDLRPFPEFQAMLGEQVDAFWLRVLERREPDADGSDSARRALFALHPELLDEVVELDDEAEAVADEMEAINAALSTLEGRKRFINNRVLQVIADEKIGLLGSERYWNTYIVDERERLCGACNASHGVTKGYRAVRLMAPRKKPHGVPVERRQLSLDASPEIMRLIQASIAMLQGVRS